MPLYNPKNIYLLSESGKVEGFDELANKLKRLSLSEEMRFREVKKLLKKEVQPLVAAARKEAYKGIQKKGKATKDKRNAKFYNLYSSIGSFLNKGTERAYIVVGLLSPHKKGAIYGASQLAGAGPGMSKNGKRVGVSRTTSVSSLKEKKGVTYRIQPKDFIGKAIKNTNVLRQSQRRMQKHIQKRIKAVLR